jgi:hypothetical protein
MPFWPDRTVAKVGRIIENSNSRLCFVALQNATMAIGRSRRPRGPTYARGTNRSQFEDPELADNARHLVTRRAHPAFKFFYVAHSGSGKFQF